MLQANEWKLILSSDGELLLSYTDRLLQLSREASEALTEMLKA